MFNKFGRLIFVLLLFLGLSACELGETDLRLHMPRHGALEGDVLQPIFAQQSGLEIIDAELVTRQSGLQALVSQEADLALVENSSPFQPGVRVVLPVYKSVLHILVLESSQLDDPEQPLRGQSIYISNDSPAGKLFVEMAGSRQGLSFEELDVVDELVPGETDVIIYFGPISPRNPTWYVPGYRLYSLDFDDVERAMSSKAIGYMLPHIAPQVIPAQTYNLPGNERDIHTLGVDALLATHSGVSENVIYRLTKTLLEQKARFSAISPEVFSQITEDFDPLSLSFPMHSGARRYLARDEPGLLERYAETINMLVYLFFVILTGLFALARFHGHRKKDRIDKFYSRVMAIRMRAMHEPHEALLLELQQLELQAFDSLIAEKLAADESFRIFIELLTRAIDELDLPSHNKNQEKDTL